MIAMRVGFTVPEMLVKSERLHRRFVRESLTEIAEFHHLFNIPRHFERSAASRYGYAKRSKKYIRMKLRRYRQGNDLVKTGFTRREMRANRKITISGAGSKATARLTLRFAFRGGTGRFRKQGTHQQTSIEQMQKEVAATTPEERKALEQRLQERYLDRVRLTSKRQRKVT